MRRFILLIAVSIIVCFAASYIFFGLFPSALFAEFSALKLVAGIAAVLALVTFVFGLLTGDYSWVDRLWSTAPVVFGWLYSAKAGFSPLSLLAAALITLWGCRLTFNFARRGGYSGTEDYRWEILRGKISNPLLWQLFSLFFISCFQIGLFVLFTSPFVHVGAASNTTLLVLSVLFMLGFLLLETMADQQQWNFQNMKHGGEEGHAKAAELGLSQDVSDGFLQSGLFSISRHPNYLGELGFWWSFYVFGVASGASIVNWTLVGPIVLTALFIGSTVFTEQISQSKYASYGQYKSLTSAIVPFKALFLQTRDERAESGL